MNQKAAGRLNPYEAEIAEEFDTDVGQGLSSAEAGRRLAENRKKYLAKEKKRLWIESITQEYLEPLFLFLSFLTVVLYEVKAAELGLALVCLAVSAALKGRQIFHNYKLLKKRRECLPDIQVLRDGRYRLVDERELVVGDVLRMKYGARVPVNIQSLSTGKRYERGEIFSEESGKAVATALPSVTLKKRKKTVGEILEGWKTLPLRAQENERARQVWQTYEHLVSSLQETMLIVLCFFCIAMLLVGIRLEQHWFFQGMFFLTTAICGGLSVWKEVLWLWYMHR